MIYHSNKQHGGGSMKATTLNEIIAMTRAEFQSMMRLRNRNEYMSRRDRKLEAQKRYYLGHHEQIMAYQRKYRARNREPIEPPYIPPSTEACEASLPYALRQKKTELRAEFLKIPITERPPYDYFLRCKTIEHIVENYERREQPTTDAIA
jgi:hypothetical protein